MKRVAVLILLLASVISYGQKYTPFPEDTAVWESRYQNPPGGPYTIFDFYRYTMMGDTMVNAISYNKIYLQHYKETYLQTPTYTYDPIGYYAAVRQDSVARKVFTIFKDSTSERLLYDFSIKQVNDTIHNCWVNSYTNAPPPTTSCSPNINQCYCACAIINQVDSLLSPWGRYYRAYGFNAGYWGGPPPPLPAFTPAQMLSGYDGYLIEGIGSAWGLFEKLYSNYEFSAYSLVYFCDSRYGNCNTGAVSVHQYETLPVALSPNPAGRELFVKQPWDDADISIADIIGNSILNQKADEGNIRIDISSLPAGIYFLVVSSVSGSTVRKFVKD